MSCILVRLFVPRQMSSVNRLLVKFSSTVQCQQPNDTEEQFKNYSAYFLNSNRHVMFQRNSNKIYQFDDETRNPIVWPYQNSQDNKCTWNQSTANLEDTELVDAFQQMLTYAMANGISLSDSQFDQFIDDFTQRLQQFSINDAMRALQSFCRIPCDRIKIRQRNYIDLFYAFDQAMTIKSEDLLLEQLLFLSSIWINIAHAKRSYYTRLICRLFNRYTKIMSAPQIAQALVFNNALSQPMTDIRAFENTLEETIDDFTIEEFSMVLWTFIRLDTKIEKQELRNKMFAYLEKQDLNRLSDSMLNKILIICGRIHTDTVAHSKHWVNISQNMRSSLDSRSLKTCILMANVGVPIRLFDDVINSIIFKRCLANPDDLKELSMQDLEYLSRLISMVIYNNENIIQRIGHLLLIEIKTRLDNVAARGFFLNLTNIVRNLTMLNIYDLELLENLFRPDYIKFIYKNCKLIDPQLYEIDGYNRINLKSIYNGNLLPDRYLEKLCYVVNWVPNRKERYDKKDEFSYAIEDAVRKWFPHCQYAHAIAHRKHADLIACIDRNTLKSIDISTNFPPLYSGKMIEAKSLTKDNPNAIVFAFVAGNTKEFLLHKLHNGDCIPLGYLAQKIDQLQRLGFYPIVVPIQQWKQSRLIGNESLEHFIINKINQQLRMVGISSELKMISDDVDEPH